MSNFWRAVKIMAHMGSWVRLLINVCATGHNRDFLHHTAYANAHNNTNFTFYLLVLVTIIWLHQYCLSYEYHIIIKLWSFTLHACILLLFYFYTKVTQLCKRHTKSAPSQGHPTKFIGSCINKFNAQRGTKKNCLIPRIIFAAGDGDGRCGGRWVDDIKRSTMHRDKKNTS